MKGIEADLPADGKRINFTLTPISIVTLTPISIDRTSIMAFKNEYTLPPEQESSEFIKKALKDHEYEFLRSNEWTLDRANARALILSGRGHEIDDHDEEYWYYLDGDDTYKFTTKETNYSIIFIEEKKTDLITRDILHFWGEVGAIHYAGLPDERVIQDIKAAFEVYGANGIISENRPCQHTLLWQGEPV